ncbi:hypothetical protein A6F65_01494 [Paraurantiacibacter namhicola]|uniref:Uncharacterized protein n=1 Tax=Paraurantiacibacter namhicola TaxID=645517 RepID=A0A1C7D8N1_9SPHN|nr:hypothetical protein A6F65_01494 [Paraurantiacibacter namhicola]
MAKGHLHGRPSLCEGVGAKSGDGAKRQPSEPGVEDGLTHRSRPQGWTKGEPKVEEDEEQPRVRKLKDDSYD